MAKILSVGIATLDIINEVETYPLENQEIRALNQVKCRGGNAANTAVVLSQLGNHCYWAGTLADETDTQTILDDFNALKVSTDFCEILPEGKIPTSYITLNKSNGTRTIIHYRNLPEYSFTSFRKIKLSAFDWIHFEGRNVSETVQMMQYSKTIYSEIPISLEVEKPRKNIEQLLAIADYIIFSKPYALSQGFDSAQELLISMKKQFPDKTLVCAWGEKGALACKNNQILSQNAFIPDTVVDTLGAGDVFNAGIIHQLLAHADISAALLFACRLAGKKCAAKGLENLTIN